MFFSVQNCLTFFLSKNLERHLLSEKCYKSFPLERAIKISLELFRIDGHKLIRVIHSEIYIAFFFCNELKAMQAKTA